MTELINHITYISTEIKELYGDEYAEQYNYAINNIQNNMQDNTNIETTHIIVDLLDLTMNNDTKQKQINNLKKEINELKDDNNVKNIKIAKLEKDNITQNIKIANLEKDNKLLKEDNKKKDIRITNLERDNRILKEDNKLLKKRINILETNKNIFDALVKLHECNALVNKEFKRLYKKKFNLSKYDNNVPNIGDFIENPPTKEDGDDYDFWIEFNNLYPGSDNENFRKIYKQIANNRADAGAHISVNKLNETEFDKLIELVYPTEYNENKKIYNEYREWLFMFPV